MGPNLTYLFKRRANELSNRYAERSRLVIENESVSSAALIARTARGRCTIDTNGCVESEHAADVLLCASCIPA